MDERELLELTRKTAEMLFGPHRKGDSAYVLWRQFDPELAKQLSMFYTGRMFAREVLSQKQRELCVVAALTVTGYADELHLHCNAALNVGAAPQESGSHRPRREVRSGTWEVGGGRRDAGVVSVGRRNRRLSRLNFAERAASQSVAEPPPT